MNGGVALAIVFVAVLTITATRKVAIKKGFMPGYWMLAALLLGPLVLLVVLIWPRRKMSEQSSSVP